MVVEKNKRKSMPQTPKTPNAGANKQTPSPKKAKFENNKEKKFNTPQQQKQSPQKPTPKKFEKSPGAEAPDNKTPKKMNIEVVKNGKSPLNKIQKDKHPIQKQKNKPGNNTKPFNKKPFNKDGQKQNKGPGNTDGKNKQGNKDFKKGTKKNRYQRLQQKLSEKVSTEESRARALKMEQDLIQEKGRVLTVRLPDETITQESVKKWSGAIENAIFPKPIEPRTFLIVLKPKSNIKKEIDNLKKIGFGGGKIIVEERNDFEKGFNNAQGIDPYTLYITNLSMEVTREDLTEFFPQSDHVMNPRKHNPGKTSGNLTKFAFVSFKTTEEALENLKEKYNAEIKGSSMVMRFRRVNLYDKNPTDTAKAEANKAKGKTEVAKTATPAKTEAAKKATPAKQEQAKKGAPAKAELGKGAKVKQEVKESDDDDEDDDDEEEDDDDEGFPVLGGAGEEEEDDDDDDDDEEEDDDDDDLGEEEDDDSDE